MRYPGFAGGSSHGIDAIVSGERCINMFPHRADIGGGQGKPMLLPCPGFETFANLPKSSGRGIFEDRDRVFVVFGDGLYELNPISGAETSMGSVLVDTSPARFETNGDGGEELAIVSGGALNILALDTGVYTANVISPSHFIAQVDGFFVSLDTDTSTIRASDIYDGLTWDPTVSAQRTAASDKWRAMVAVRRELYLIGEKTGEVWYNARKALFPFAPRPGTSFEVGITAPATLQIVAGSPAWMGRSRDGSGEVFHMNGYYPEPIATPELRYRIQQYEDVSDISDTVGWSYEREGHIFYVLNFRGVQRTWVYDVTTRRWHERAKWDSNAMDWQTYRAQFHAVSRGQNLVCDPSGSKVYRFNSSVFTDVNGDPLRRFRRMPMLQSELRYVNYRRVELDCLVGIGTGSGQGEDPVVNLSYSDDGGHTFGSAMPRRVGKIGERMTEVVWNSLGRSNRRVFDLWSTDPVSTIWCDFYVNGRG